MLYYRVPACLDQAPLYKKTRDGSRQRNGFFLIGGELLTASEANKINAPLDKLEPIQLKKTAVYSSFGARFIKKEV